MCSTSGKNGESNPNWKGGLLSKSCEQCGAEYSVKRCRAGSRFCSLRCVGLSQRGKGKSRGRRVVKQCEVCAEEFSVFASHANRQHCCSKQCSHKRRSALSAGEANPNWLGGVSRLPYPWNFRQISRAIIERDGGVCQNPTCRGADIRLTTHHIDYDKENCAPENLICLCSSCNSRANFGRERWRKLYAGIVSSRPLPV